MRIHKVGGFFALLHLQTVSFRLEFAQKAEHLMDTRTFHKIHIYLKNVLNSPSLTKFAR